MDLRASSLLKLTPLALVLGAIAATLRVPYPEPTEVELRSTRLADLAIRRFAALSRWSALEQRDSAIALSSRIPASDSLTIVLEGFSPKTHASQVRQSLGPLLTSLGRSDSTVRVAMLIYNSKRYDPRSRWGLYSGVWTRSRAGIRWCISIVPAEELGVGRVEVSPSSFGSSPCVLFAAFGEPGPEVGRWLESNRYAFAASNNWQSMPSGWRDGYQQPPWQSSFDPSWFEASVAVRTIRLWEIRPGAIALSLAPPYQLGTLALRCLVGDQVSCARSAMDTTSIVRRAEGLPSGLTLGFSPAIWATVSLLEPRPLAGWYLSDLIRKMGRERFRVFWKSERPVQEAFQSSFGEEIGHWTLRWARDQWEASVERSFGNREIILGATLAPSWPLLVVGWSVLALVAVAWTIQRREVT